MYQIKGKEADITGEICNEHGIKILKFSQPRGPIFHYEPPTNETFGDQPHLQDPLDKKYVVIRKSNISPDAGEGLFANRNVPANTIYSLYSGKLYQPKEIKILEMEKKWSLANESNELGLKFDSHWMYRYVEGVYSFYVNSIFENSLNTSCKISIRLKI